MASEDWTECMSDGALSKKIERGMSNPEHDYESLG